MEIYEKIRWLRLKLNLSQKVFAESIETSRSVISQIEIGKLKPSIEMIIKLSKKFQVPYSFFLEADFQLSETLPNQKLELCSLENKPYPNPNCIQCQNLIKINQAQENVIQSLKKTIAAQEKLIHLYESKLIFIPETVLKDQ